VTDEDTARLLVLNLFPTKGAISEMELRLNKQGHTPLMKACMCENAAMVHALLTCQYKSATAAVSQINAADVDGFSALHHASRSKNPIVLRYLLDLSSGINLNARIKHGHTALNLACLDGNAESVRQLLELPDIDVNIANANGTTPLHQVCQQPDRLELVRLLIGSNKADINAVTATGQTPLHEASSKGSVDKVQELLKRCDIDVNAADNEGNTALHFAIGQGYRRVAELLIGHWRCATMGHMHKACSPGENMTRQTIVPLQCLLRV